MKDIQIKRIYDDVSSDVSSSEETYRLLIDRVWPRGISKDKAKLDEWNKEIAPSTELRKWFDHKEERFEEFTKRYKTELSQHQDELNRLIEITNNKELLLLYGAKNTKINQAVVLREILIDLQPK